MRALLVFRPLNLLIVAVLQLLTFYFLDFEHHSVNIRVWYLVASTVLIAACGYLFNDYLDQRADVINKPDKMYISRWSPLAIWIVFLVFNALALFLSLLVSTQLFYLHSGVVLVLILYSVILKRLPLLGNFIISLLAAFSVYVVFLTFGLQDKKLVIFYAGFAALLTYLREIVKDMQDIHGDKKSGYSTFPVMAGIDQSRTIVLITGAFVLVCYGNLLYQWIGPQFKMPVQLVVWMYHVVCVVLPLLGFMYLTYQSNNKEDYGRLSTLAKYIMATGMLSMMFY